MAAILTLSAEKFEVFSGKKEYVVDLKDGDCQVDYRVISDMPCAVYVALGDKVMPLATGSHVNGRVQIRDAKWLMVKPEKQSAVVAIQVFHSERRIVDENDGVPVAVYVPTLPPIDLMAQVRRMVGQQLEEDERYIAVDEDDLLPDDMDEEFGAGSTQFEEDYEIEEALRAYQERESSAPESKGEPGGVAETREGGEGGEKPPAKPKRKSKKPDAEEQQEPPVE